MSFDCSLNYSGDKYTNKNRRSIDSFLFFLFLLIILEYAATPATTL